MPRRVFVIALLVMLAAGEARAQQLWLSANNCMGPISASNACTSNTGTALSLVGFATIPAGSRPGFIATESWLEVATPMPTMVDWWRADACRAGAFSAVATPFMDDNCGSLWDAGPAPVTSLSVVYPLWKSPSIIRYVITSTLPDSAAYDLTGGVDPMAVFKLVVLSANTVGEASCAGCATAACLDFTRLALIRQGETAETAESIVWHAGPHGGHTFAWQGGACFPDAIQKRTWGMLKSLYR